MPQPRIPAGDKRRGQIHPGEFAAPKPGKGRKTGAKLPPSAPVIRNGPGGGGATPGSSAKEREALAKEHESRLPDEMAGDFRCANCGWGGWREHPVVTREGKMHATLAFQGCTRCGTMHTAHVGIAGVHSPQHSTARRESARPSRSEAPTGRGGLATVGRSRKPVSKTIDSGETAVQAQDLEGGTTQLQDPDLQGVEYVGHRRNCPRGGDSPCGAEVDGACGICSAPVRDHEALGKTAATLVDLRKLAGLT